MNYDKKILNSYEEGTKKEFVITNSRGTYMSTTIIGENTKPYHGLFVKASLDKTFGCPNPNNVKVLVSNMLETIKTGKEDIKLYSLRTKNGIEEGYKYQKRFSKKYIPTFEYSVGKVYVSKKMTLVHKEEILYLEYRIENRGESEIKFRIEPLLTYRSLYTMRNKHGLPFTKRDVKNGVRVNLNIEKQDFVVVKTKDAVYRPETKFLEGVEYIHNNKKYTEDLFIPGQFDVKVPPMDSRVVRIILSTMDLPIDNIEKINYLKLEEERIDRFLSNMQNSREEIKMLALSAHELETRNMKNLRKSLLGSIPLRNDNISSVLRMIEGTFLIPKKVYQAREVLRSVGKLMKDGLIQVSLSNKKIETSRERVEASFFYAETINTYMKYSENYDLDKVYFLPILKNIIYAVLDEKNEDSYFFEDYLIGVKNGASYDKYLDINILWYNTLMIYLEMRNDKDVTHDKLLRIANMTKQAIIDNFYSEELKLFKYKIDESFEDARVEMVYSLSLSYPLLHNEIARDVLETLYKEYYTDLGMRIYKKDSQNYDGFVYPKYLAHFMKASTRLNAISEVTKKTSRSLVKEILKEVDESCIGALPEKYNEVTKEEDGCLMYGESIAEVIRIYDMLK